MEWDWRRMRGIGSERERENEPSPIGIVIISPWPDDKRLRTERRRRRRRSLQNTKPHSGEKFFTIVLVTREVTARRINSNRPADERRVNIRKTVMYSICRLLRLIVFLRVEYGFPFFDFLLLRVRWISMIRENFSNSKSINRGALPPRFPFKVKLYIGALREPGSNAVWLHLNITFLLQTIIRLLNRRAFLCGANTVSFFAPLRNIDRETR